jgi:hypothetical protein
MSIMNADGDLKVVWNSDNQPEIDAARNQFNELKKKGYLAYRTDKKGEKAQIITEFDPTAEAVILSPPMRGG